jgi:hypothetical protein
VPRLKLAIFPLLQGFAPGKGSDEKMFEVPKNPPVKTPKDAE